jgi:hypothetical protein
VGIEATLTGRTFGGVLVWGSNKDCLPSRCHAAFVTGDGTRRDPFPVGEVETTSSTKRGGHAMKFLLTAKIASFPGMTPTPPAVMQSLNLAAKAYVKARFEDGTFDCHYIFPDGGGFVIANADSHEKVLNILLEYPLYPVFVWEVKALCDWSYSYDTFTKFWGALKG